MDKFIIALDEFMINNKICIELNYKIQLDNLSADVISENINRDLGNIINQYSVKEDGLVFLLDISRVNRKDLDVPKVKKIITSLCDNYPDMLHKCVVYNYSKTVKMLFNLIKNFLDKVTADKIVIDESVSTIINQVTNNPDMLDKFTTDSN